MTMRYFRSSDGEVHGYDDATQADGVASCIAAGWTDITGSWPPPQPTPMPAQIAAEALTSGIAITSTATPSLNGTYGCAPSDQANITAIITGIAAGEGLPGGGASFYWVDMTGAPYSFTQAQFLTLAKAIRDYVYALDMFALGAAPQPVATATIP